MNTAVTEIIERYKRLPASDRREVLAKLREVETDWHVEFAELDQLLPDMTVSMAEIQNEINAYRLEQTQKARQILPGHS